MLFPAAQTLWEWGGRAGWSFSEEKWNFRFLLAVHSCQRHLLDLDEFVVVELQPCLTTWSLCFWKQDKHPLSLDVIPGQSGLCSGISRISCCSVLLLLDHLEPLRVWWRQRVEVFWVLFPSPVGAWPWAVLAGRAHSLEGPWCSCSGKPQAQELFGPFELSDRKAGLGRISRKPVNGLGKDGFENLFCWVFYPGSCCLFVAVTDWNSLFFSIFI